MLVRELLKEHADWSNDKSLESDLAIALIDFATSGKIELSKLSEKGQKLSKHILTTCKSICGDEVTIFGKPSGSKPTYGSGSEPKSDLNFETNGKIYAASIKSGPAYAMSAGSKSEYLGIAAATVQLYEELFPEEAQESKLKIIESLMPIAELIGRDIKDADYTTKSLNDKKDGWFNRHLEKHAAKFSVDDVAEIRSLQKDAEKIIDDDNNKKAGSYKARLKQMEAVAKSGLKDCFENVNFARCFIWEISTGVKKFNGVDTIRNFSDPNAAYANTIIYLDGAGIYDVSNIMCKYVSDSIKGHTVRLQNVPRGWAGVYFRDVRAGASRNAQTLADSLRMIEMSLKIGTGPVKKIKEHNLSELQVSSEVLVSNLQRALAKSDLLDICSAFGIQPGLSS